MSDPIMRPPSLLGSETEEMTRKQTEIFLRLYMIEELHKDIDMKENEIPFTYKVMEARIGQHPTAKITTCCKLAVASICDTPAKAVMWAYTLCRIAEYEELPVVTLTKLANHFPHGFPTEESYKKVWDAQKNPESPLGNLLDTPIVWNPEAWKPVDDVTTDE